jgi:hypothetical protein
MISLTKFFWKKKIHLDTHQKNPYHFEQVDFNMFVVIGWSYFLLVIWLIILINQAMDHLTCQIKIIYF